MTQYHRVRSSVPEVEAGFAPVRLERHRDGISCETAAAYTYDANGHKRWCIDCGVELGERSWHPNGADVSNRSLGGALVALLLLLVLAGVLIWGSLAWKVLVGDTPAVPVHTPTTYGPPPTVVP